MASVVSTLLEITILNVWRGIPPALIDNFFFLKFTFKNSFQDLEGVVFFIKVEIV